MRLLVGLGNPGSKYERTRHNIGFRVAEEVARACGASLDSSRFQGLLGQGRAGSEPVVILLPQTYMNVSGESVGPAARFWKISLGDVCVVHDELDLEFGRVQVKVGGGDGGHNGLKSLRQHLGAEFVRIRVGIGRPPPGWDPADYVLGKFTGDEENQLGPAIETATFAALDVLKDGASIAMNKWNRRDGKKKEPKEAKERKEPAKDEAGSRKPEAGSPPRTHEQDPKQ